MLLVYPILILLLDDTIIFYLDSYIGYRKDLMINVLKSKYYRFSIILKFMILILLF